MRASFVIVFFITHVFGINHNINMSVTDITLKEKRLAMKIKFFADDLQGSLSLASKVPVDLINTPLEKNTILIRKYTEKRLKVMINNVPVLWKFKKAFLHDDVIFVEYESFLKEPHKIKSLQVKNVLMFEDFPEQKNIVNLHLNGKDEILDFSNGKDIKFKQMLLNY